MYKDSMDGLSVTNYSAVVAATLAPNLYTSEASFDALV